MISIRDKKSKIIIIILILALGTILNIYFSTLLHEMLSKDISELGLPSFESSIYSLESNKQHRQLFIIFQLTIILASTLYAFTNQKTYQSDLIKITPNIVTPSPAGQKQFGSARWMTKEEKDTQFTNCILDEDDIIISHLIKHGNDDLKSEKVGD